MYFSNKYNIYKNKLTKVNNHINFVFYLKLEKILYEISLIYNRFIIL